MHRFPPLPPAAHPPRRPLIAMTLADLPLGELAILTLISALLLV